MKLHEIMIKNRKDYLYENQDDIFVNECVIEQIKYEDRSGR